MNVQIETDSLTKVARQNWSGALKPAFKPELVVSIYENELHGSKAEPPKLRRIMLLEISQYLENFLIPNCTEVSWPRQMHASPLAKPNQAYSCGTMNTVLIQGFMI